MSVQGVGLAFRLQNSFGQHHDLPGLREVGIQQGRHPAVAAHSIQMGKVKLPLMRNSKIVTCNPLFSLCHHTSPFHDAAFESLSISHTESLGTPLAVRGLRLQWGQGSIPVGELDLQAVMKCLCRTKIQHAGMKDRQGAPMQARLTKKDRGGVPITSFRNSSRACLSQKETECCRR